MEKICTRFENWLDQRAFVSIFLVWFFVPLATAPTAYLDYKKNGFRKSWPLLITHLLIEFDKLLIAALIYVVANGYIKP